MIAALLCGKNLWNLHQTIKNRNTNHFWQSRKKTDETLKLSPKKEDAILPPPNLSVQTRQKSTIKLSRGTYTDGIYR
jgi:hypothetical protein